MMGYYDCKTQPEQLAWVRSRLRACPFCGGAENNLTVHYGDGQWQIGCRDVACVKPEVFHRDGKMALVAWNSRPDAGDFVSDLDAALDALDEVEGELHALRGSGLTRDEALAAVAKVRDRRAHAGKAST